MAEVAFISSPQYLEHYAGLGHPESPQRLASIWEELDRRGLRDRLVLLDPAPATEEQVCLVHDPAYVALARREIEAGRSVLSTGDTNVCRRSYAAALLAAGGAVTGVDAVCGGDVRSAFCAVRPPGHHAAPAAGMGFCIFNNAAVAARHALSARGLGRVLIVDWDYHHGNGTQEAFYADPAVFYFSVHCNDAYPMPLTGAGHAKQTGAGAAAGTNLNCPLPPGAGDGEYADAFAGRLAPAMEKFAPELVIVSAGFDCLAGDTLGSFAVTEAGIVRLTEMVMDIAGRWAGGRIVSVLEGGYNLALLASAAAAHVETLLG